MPRLIGVPACQARPCNDNGAIRTTVLFEWYKIYCIQCSHPMVYCFATETEQQLSLARCTTTTPRNM